MPIFCCGLLAHAYFSSFNEFGKGSDFGIHILGQLCGCSWWCSVRIAGNCFDTLHDICNGANALVNDDTCLCLTFFPTRTVLIPMEGLLQLFPGVLKYNQVTLPPTLQQTVLLPFTTAEEQFCI